MATFTLDDGTNKIDVTLEYNYVFDNSWSAPRGELPANSGTWTSSSVAKRVILSDSKQVLYMDHVPIRASWGYPFDAKDIGKSGEGLILGTGGHIGKTSGGVFGWTLKSA